jgi:predicted MFS family arabinose efflux permease
MPIPVLVQRASDGPVSAPRLIAPAAAAPPASNFWIIALSGAMIVGFAMGTRNVMGLYLPPVTKSLEIGREAFGLAMALANILWGMGAPFAGAISDKLGTGRVVVGGTALTVAGLYFMYAAKSSTDLLVSGVLLGLGICGTGVTTLIGAVGQKSPPERRMSAMALVSTGSGIGILVALPFVHLLIEMVGWRMSLLCLAAVTALALPLALPLAGKPAAPAAGAPKSQSLKEALGEAFRLPSFWLLTAGYFVCGFHVTFYSVHLPGYVADQGFAPHVAAWALMAVGLCNIIGTWGFSWLSGYTGKRLSLSAIYFLRAVIFLGFLFLPMTPLTLILLSASIGFLWLTTVPLTAGLVATFFGTTWLAMLNGIVFFSHQVGAFVGVWAAGYLYDLTRSYDIMWWISCALGVFAGLVHLPIRERPVPRLAAKAA